MMHYLDWQMDVCGVNNKVLIYEYGNERVSSELFSRRQVINKTYMDENQIIIYYPRKIIDISNLHVACILPSQFRTKMFKDRFVEELDGYITTLKIDRLKLVKEHSRNRIDFYNGSSILFLSDNIYRDVLRGLSFTNIITYSDIDVQKLLGRLRKV